MSDIKQRLLDYCREFVSSRISGIKSNIHQMQDAANEETKSSAGDKYETGRAMMQIEIENLNAQLAEFTKLNQVLENIKLEKKATAQPGSLVITSSGNYFISISAGQIKLDNNIYFAVSASSPIGVLLIGKKAGDQFSLNNKSISVKEVL